MRWQFWKWLFLGLEGKAGFRLLTDRWLIVHIIVGLMLSYFVKVPLHEAAQTVLLPLAGIFVGLSFAWAGNAQALLQSSEIEELSEYDKDGIQKFIYNFQLSILIILITMISWGLAGLKLFSACHNYILIIAIEVILYFLSSLTMRECWHVVLGSQMLILSRHSIRRAMNNQRKGDQ